MARRPLLLAAAALIAAAAPADAQLAFGAHVARANDVFGGANGVGATVGVGVPLFPVAGMVSGDYFFPDCGAADGCGYLGGSASVVFRIPMLLVRPYVTGGLVWRRYTASDAVGSVSNQGVGAGVGLDLNTLVLRGFAEARYEWVDPDDQFVFRLGILF